MPPTRFQKARSKMLGMLRILFGRKNMGNIRESVTSVVLDVTYIVSIQKSNASVGGCRIWRRNMGRLGENGLF